MGTELERAIARQMNQFLYQNQPMPRGVEFYFYSLDLSPYVDHVESWDEKGSISQQSQLHIWLDFPQYALPLLDTLRLMSQVAPAVGGRLYFYQPPDTRYCWKSCGWNLTEESWYKTGYVNLQFRHQSYAYAYREMRGYFAEP